MKKPTYDIYPEYEKCIQKLTWKWVKRSKFDFTELLSEAYQGFIHAVDTYDKTKGACFHTWLYITIEGRLKNFMNQKDYFNSFNENINLTVIESKESNPEQNTIFKLLIENLSKEAKEIIDVILNTPNEMISLVKAMSSNRQGHMHVYKSNIRSYFQNKGWKNTLILSCFEEIQSTFN